MGSEVGSQLEGLLDDGRPEEGRDEGVLELG